VTHQTNHKKGILKYDNRTTLQKILILKYENYFTKKLIFKYENYFTKIHILKYNRYIITPDKKKLILKYHNRTYSTKQKSHIKI
jgi:hypothetical protein